MNQMERRKIAAADRIDKTEKKERNFPRYVSEKFAKSEVNSANMQMYTHCFIARQVNDARKCHGFR